MVGVLSDTHDNLPMIERAAAVLCARGVQVLLHAGDYVAPFALKLLMRRGIPLIGVFGNNDGERNGLSKINGEVLEGPYRLALEGRTVLIAHEPEVLADAVRPGDELAICGRTHQPAICFGPPLAVSPGEAGGWLTGRATGVIVDLENLTAEVVEFGKQEGPTP